MARRVPHAQRHAHVKGVLRPRGGLQGSLRLRLLRAARAARARENGLVRRGGVRGRGRAGPGASRASRAGTPPTLEARSLPFIITIKCFENDYLKAQGDGKIKCFENDTGAWVSHSKGVTILFDESWGAADVGVGSAGHHVDDSDRHGGAPAAVHRGAAAAGRAAVPRVGDNGARAPCLLLSYPSPTTDAISQLEVLFAIPLMMMI